MSFSLSFDLLTPSIHAGQATLPVARQTNGRTDQSAGWAGDSTHAVLIEVLSWGKGI
jgi:hypothetical protein